MPPKSTPEERSALARLGAYALHAQYDPRETTAAARAASPGADSYWVEKARALADDPNLPDEELARRADYLKRAHFQRLAIAVDAGAPSSQGATHRRPEVTRGFQ